MPLPIITNTLRAAVQGVCPSGAPAVNVLHFRKTGGPWSPTDVNALDVKLLKLLTGPAYTGGLALGIWANNAVAAMALSQISYTILDGSSATTVTTHVVPGGGTGTRMPDELSTVITLRTPTRGRSFRGRIYLPPKDTSMNSNGVVSATAIPQYLAQCNGFITDLATIAIEWVVASYKLSTATAITSVTMDQFFDVQRRRKK